MRACVQRVNRCSVNVEGERIGSIGRGILILLGIRNGDTMADGEYLAKRCASVRIFDDDSGKMNLSVEDVSGEAMVVSQFTLYGDTRKGNRPNYTDSAPADIARPLYDNFSGCLKDLLGNQHVSCGVFGAMMDVELVNDGPVTLIIDSKS